ncbi:MAG TPA: thioredoxin-like domain-containing protein [Gemmataceae bacterium]|nr:thioredoxin-like domain-containing protein [Gemmataceae bacterium]
MSIPAAPNTSPARWLPALLGIGVGHAVIVGLAVSGGRPGADQARADEKAAKGPAEKKADAPPAKKAEEPEDDLPKNRNKAPEFEPGLPWLNTGKPLTFKDLKGKVVLLDFWTYCCINCIHIMPDLAKLEKKWANELVVIGVHSAKFETEKNSESIRKAMLRYEIQHPVVNDGDQKIWEAYDCRSWPTLVVIDAEGNVVGRGSGEGLYDALDRVIGQLVAEAKKKGVLNDKPIRFDTAAFRDKVDSPLYFPGKVLADEKSDRLFIADSTNHRIVVTDLKGQAVAVAGTGVPGRKDGAFAAAQFDDPQGMALVGDTLYVADRKNHLIRGLDLKAKTVKTVAGTGEQDRDRAEGGPALERGLNSPWDLYPAGDKLFVAMAGHHQIWTLDLKQMRLDPFAGDGRENIKDGPPEIARFAQPSGLTSDGTNLYVADCEVSAVRKVPMDGKGRVTTLVGRGLFDFGDRDGPGRNDEDKSVEAQLQHAIGVLHHEGTVYVADTYNSKLKAIDLKTNQVTTVVGGKKGDKDLPFNEPTGLSLANGKIYIADTNAHRIRVYDLKTKALTTLPLTGVEPVKAKDEK